MAPKRANAAPEQKQPAPRRRSTRHARSTPPPSQQASSPVVYDLRRSHDEVRTPAPAHVANVAVASTQADLGARLAELRARLDETMQRLLELERVVNACIARF